MVNKNFKKMKDNELITYVIDLANTLDGTGYKDDCNMLYEFLDRFECMQDKIDELNKEIDNLWKHEQEDNTFSGGIYE